MVYSYNKKELTTVAIFCSNTKELPIWISQSQRWTIEAKHNRIYTYICVFIYITCFYLYKIQIPASESAGMEVIIVVTFCADGSENVCEEKWGAHSDVQSDLRSDLWRVHKIHKAVHWWYVHFSILFYSSIKVKYK